jgi:hypothetical protein
MARGRQRWRRARVVCALLLFYLLSYVVLSALGTYRIDISGRTRFPSGVGLTDCELWQPLGMYHKRYLSVGGTWSTTADLPGYLYALLITADRAWVHKSHYLFE